MTQFYCMHQPARITYNIIGVTYLKYWIVNFILNLGLHMKERLQKMCVAVTTDVSVIRNQCFLTGRTSAVICQAILHMHFRNGRDTFKLSRERTRSSREHEDGKVTAAANNKWNMLAKASRCRRTPDAHNPTDGLSSWMITRVDHLWKFADWRPERRSVL
jgi:hypothetical protein